VPIFMPKMLRVMWFMSLISNISSGLTPGEVCPSEEETQVVNELLEVGRCSIKTTKKTKNQAKNLFFAISRGNAAIVKNLVEEGAEVNTVSNRGQSPLYIGTF
jgi:hypothetical protein